VHAALARELATTLGGAQWRFAITDEQGHLSHCGITAARPTGAPGRMAACRAIVELQVSVSLLVVLEAQPNELGAWTGVVTDLIRQWETSNVSDTSYTSNIHRRTPGLPLRRYLVARDRSCTMIGCRVPARTADADHTCDYGRGGPTTDDNLGAVCRHDHRLKHEGGWQVHQPQRGYFRWTSRLGRSYLRQPAPIMEPLPEPYASTRPLVVVVPVDAGWETSEIWSHPPPGHEPESSSPPTPHPQDDLPPF
jgi:hypothetical protein